MPTNLSAVPIEAIRKNARLTFLNLPNEIFRMIFDNLDLPDRASLALTCKPVALKLDTHKLLLWDSVQLKRLRKNEGDPLAELLRGRLGKSWIPADLKYCCKCAKFVPRCRRLWKMKLYKEFSMKSGTVGQKFRRWMQSDAVMAMGSTTVDRECLRWLDPKPQTCPRCRLLA